MGENFENLAPNYGFKLPLKNNKLVTVSQLIVTNILTPRALTESLDKCRRRYQVRIRRLEQHCAWLHLACPVRLQVEGPDRSRGEARSRQPSRLAG